jgi:hypothetical protein
MHYRRGLLVCSTASGFKSRADLFGDVVDIAEAAAPLDLAADDLLTIVGGGWWP